MFYSEEDLMISLQSSKIIQIPEIEQAINNSLIAINTTFNYPDPSGDKELRYLIKDYHKHWDGDVLITNSATEATFLSLSLIAGGKLALNVPSYFGVIRQAKELNIEIIEWTTIEELEAIKECDAILLTSNFTPPSGKSFSDDDKKRIAEYADLKGRLVIEDNAYEFLSYGNNKLSSIPYYNTIRINSFSKLLTPSLRLGFIMTNDVLFKKVRSKKITMNLSSSDIPQQIIFNVLKNKKLLNLWQKELESRAKIIIEEINENFDYNLIINDGGSFIKFEINKNVNITDFILKAKDNFLLLDDNKNQYKDNESKQYLRLHLGAISKEDIPNAIKILKKIM